jgi:hypothetical protein
MPALQARQDGLRATAYGPQLYFIPPASPGRALDQEQSPPVSKRIEAADASDGEEGVPHGGQREPVVHQYSVPDH